MGSDLKYQTDAYLKRQYKYHRCEQNVHKMKADAIANEQARRYAAAQPMPYRDEYEAYFERCDKANRIAMTYDEWVKALDR